MKNHFILALLILFTQITAWSAPISPMEGYTPSEISESKMQRVWRSMETEVKNKDCYRRAHIWAYEMYRDFGVQSTKIFFHYTNKWNYELDKMGGEFYGRFGLGKIKQKAFDVPGISKRTRDMVRSNITWDYHVSPMVIVDGEETVMDRTLNLAYDHNPSDYSENEAWRLLKRPSTPNEWVESLTVRGEILWEARRALLKKDLRKAQKKKRYGDVRWIKNKMAELGMSSNSKIDIKCQRVDSIAEVDKNHKTAWCFYTLAPMYYYNELDLRYLAYGNTGYRYNSPPPLSVHTERNYRNGAKYIQRQFNEVEIKDAQKERKW